MSSRPLQLEGNVDHSAQEVASLREQNRQLRIENTTLKAELEATRTENAAAVASLRKALAPLYGALQQVFGDMDAIAPAADAPAGQGIAANGNSKWDAIKQRLQPRLKEAVDILLVQGSMKRTQLASAMKMDYSNCNKNVIAVLIRQGLLVDGGREGGVSLKDL